jgi:hypothetical protein
MTQNHPNPPNGTEERILLVIHDAVQHTAFSTDSIGDIILTDRAFYFLGFDEIQDLHVDFDLVGAVVAKVVWSITQKQRLNEYQKNTSRIRRGLYGLGLSKRLALKGPNMTATYNPTTFTLADVAQLRVVTESQISLSTQDAKQYFYWIPETMDLVSQDVVTKWPTSEACYDRLSDPEGFYAGSTSPRELLLRVAKGDNAAAAEIYQLGLRKDYMNVLFGNLRFLQDDDRRSVLSGFSGAPDEFRDTLLARANKIAKDSKRYIFFDILLLLVGGLLGVGAISSRDMSTGILALLLLVTGGVGSVNNLRSLKVANEVYSTL